MKRHLIYHLDFRRGFDDENVFWHTNQLSFYLDQFNGAKILILAVDRNYDHHLTNYFKDEFDFILPVLNNPRFRETPSLWIGLDVLHQAWFDRVMSGADEMKPSDDIIFFAHSKGSSHAGASKRTRDAIRYWTEAMYLINLRSMGRVEAALETHACVGVFRKKGQPSNFPPGCPWHFSGTFYWMKMNRMEGWKYKLPMHRYGAEAFPGLMWDYKESYCLMWDNIKSAYDLRELARLGVPSVLKS